MNATNEDGNYLYCCSCFKELPAAVVEIGGSTCSIFCTFKGAMTLAKLEAEDRKKSEQTS